MHSQKMISLSVLILAIFGLLSCGGDTATSFQNGDVVSVKLASLSGQVQKGPFIKGSRVTAYELENGQTLAQTGKNFTGVIQSDNGKFDISTVTLASQYAILEATGYFRSEVTGGKSNSQLTLRAITDLTSRSTVNVNLLTHLEYDRVEYLVKTEGMRVLAAKKQAEKEIFAAFGIDAEAFGYSEDLSVLDTGDANAALLAVSILLLRNNSDADLTQELTEFSQDLAADGAWDDAETKSAIADWAHALDSADHFAAFRKNVSGWGISGTVPAFEKYMTVFWNYAYGLGGVCSDDIQDSVKYVSDTYSANAGRYYICKATAWRPATTLEYDTYRWKAGADGAVRAGNINTSIYYVYDSTAAVWRAAAFTESVLGGCRTAIDDSVGLAGSTYYICDGAKRTWNTATALEYDTYRWKAGADGAVRAGNINPSIYYVYDSTAAAWRAAAFTESVLGGCRTAIDDSVGLAGSTYYICDGAKRTWNTATALEYDTYRWKAGADGAVRVGNINTSIYYVYDSTAAAWRAVAAAEPARGGCRTAIDDSVGLAGSTYYICDGAKRTWNTATAFEYDTYHWKAGTDGELRAGLVNVSKRYVYDSTTTAWRAATAAESALGGCRTAIDDSVGLAGSTYYICDGAKRTWNTATAFEYDTYHWKAGTDGELRAGNVDTTNFYVYDRTIWRTATAMESVIGCCTDAIKDSIGFFGSAHYVCENRKWSVWDVSIISNSITASYGRCRAAIKDSIVRFGGTYYICKDTSWITATSLEYNTYRWTAGTDGEMNAGIVNTELYYVYDSTSAAWRAATATETTFKSGCTTAKEGSVEAFNGVAYVCTTTNWVKQ